MSVSKLEAERCLAGLEETIDILLQQNLHRNIHTICCVIVVLQEYITFLLPLFEPLYDADRESVDIPDLTTRVSVILQIDTGGSCGIVLGDLGEGVDNRIFVEQLTNKSIAERNEEIEIDQIVLEINTHSLTRCSLQRAQVWLESAERSGTVELLLARSVSVEREDTRSRVCTAVDRLSYKLSQAAIRRSNGINDLEEVSRIVRTLTVSRPDSSDSNASIERRETKLHIRKGAKDLGIILSSVSNETETEGVSVAAVREGSVTERDGRIRVGDVIVRINGISVLGLAEERVMELLDLNRPIVQIVVRTGVNKSDQRSVIEYSEGESFESQKLDLRKQTRTENEIIQNKTVQHNVSRNKPPLPNSNIPDVFPRENPSRSEYTTRNRLSQRSDNSEEYSLGPRNSSMRSSFQVRHVALSRSASIPLGFTIAGGKGSRKGDIGIFIGHIHGHGAASQEGSMKIGDEILEVNGMSLEGMSQRKALQTFKKLKQGLITMKLKSRISQSNNTTWYDQRNVTLYKTADAGLGLELILLIDADGGYKDGIYIQNVREGSVAFQDGSLARGDQLLTVNGDPLSSSNLRKAHAIIGTLTPGSVDIGIRRYTPVAPLERLLTLAKRQNRLQPIPSQQSMRLEPRSPSYQTDASSIFLQEMNKMSSDSSENDSTLESDLTKLIAGIERANSFTAGGHTSRRDVYNLERAHGSETALRMSREELENTDIDALLSPIDTEPIKEEITQHSDSEDTTSDAFIEPLILPTPVSPHTESSKRDLERLETAKGGYSSEKVIETVSLYRSMGQTLGMNVLASNTPQGGVLVTSILKTGPAAKQGNIRVGDELLEINNKPLTGLSQSEVLSLLSSLTGDMEFKVIRTPEKGDIETAVMPVENEGNTRKLDQVSSSFSGFDMLELTFSKHSSETIGITLSPSKGHTEGYLQIRCILADGLAARDGRLKKSDRLYALDSFPLYKKATADVVKLLRQSGAVFTLIILREVNKLLHSETSLTASSLSLGSQGPSAAKRDVLTKNKYTGSFEDSLKDIRTNETLSSVLVPTRQAPDVSLDGLSGYNSEFTNITPASSVDFIADRKVVKPDQELDETADQQTHFDNKHKPHNPKRILFRKRHLIKSQNINENVDPPVPPAAPPVPPTAPPPDTKATEERRASFVQQTSSMSVTGELPRQLIFSGVHFEKQTETNELTDKPETKCVKRIKFMKLFKILGIKLSEERPGEVSVCLVATSSPLRRSVPPLETGDVLISINGTAVTSKRQAEKLLSSLEKGEHSIQAVSPPAQQDASILKEEHQENTEVNKNSSQTQQIVTPNKQLNSFQVELVARNKQDLFGLEFEETNNNICVKSIQTNSPAFECKQIQVGDRILTIDRNLFVEISSRDADRIYENLPLNKPILFTFERGTGTVGVPRVVIPRKLSFRDRIIEVDLQRGGDNKLGVVLSGGEDTNEKRVYIRRIGPNSIVSTDGRLKIGDELISVNNMPLEGITHKDALQVIRNAGDKLQFRVMRRKDFPPSPIHNTSAVREIPQHPIPNSPSVLLRSLRSSKRYINLESADCTQGNVANLLKRNKLTSTHGLRYFELVKGPVGLGLSLKGGDGSSPILVKNMQPQGNAYLSGLIEVGDEIIEINSKSFVELKLKEGIEFLKNLPIGPVNFLIKKRN